METLSEFYFAARSAFPALAEKADRAFVKYWGEPTSEASAYSWFGSASSALNNEMQKVFERIRVFLCLRAPSFPARQPRSKKLY